MTVSMLDSLLNRTNLENGNYTKSILINIIPKNETSSTGSLASNIKNNGLPAAETSNPGLSDYAMNAILFFSLSLSIFGAVGCIIFIKRCVRCPGGDDLAEQFNSGNERKHTSDPLSSLSVPDNPSIVTPSPGNTPIHTVYNPLSLGHNIAPPPSPAYTPTPSSSQYSSYSQLPTARVKNSNENSPLGLSSKIYINIISPTPSPKLFLSPKDGPDTSRTPSPCETPTLDWLPGEEETLTELQLHKQIDDNNSLISTECR